MGAYVAPGRAQRESDGSGWGGGAGPSVTQATRCCKSTLLFLGPKISLRLPRSTISQVAAQLLEITGWSRNTGGRESDAGLGGKV